MQQPNLLQAAKSSVAGMWQLPTAVQMAGHVHVPQILDPKLQTLTQWVRLAGRSSLM